MVVVVVEMRSHTVTVQQGAHMVEDLASMRG